MGIQTVGKQFSARSKRWNAGRLDRWGDLFGSTLSSLLQAVGKQFFLSAPVDDPRLPQPYAVPPPLLVHIQCPILWPTTASISSAPFSAPKPLSRQALSLPQSVSRREGRGERAWQQTDTTCCNPRPQPKRRHCEQTRQCFKKITSLQCGGPRVSAGCRRTEPG